MSRATGPRGSGSRTSGRSTATSATRRGGRPTTSSTLVLDHQVTAESRLSLRVYNLFDKVYAISGNAVNGVGTNWLLGRPRSVEVAYTVTW